MWVGTGWRATDGVEDAHRVGQSAPCTVFHWVYLEQRSIIKIRKGSNLMLFRKAHMQVNLSLGTVRILFEGEDYVFFSFCSRQGSLNF